MSEKPPRDDIDDDYAYTRRNHYDLLEQTKPVLESLKNLAEEAEHPSVYEVYFKAIKIVSDSNLEFLDLQRKKQVLDQERGKEISPPKAPFKGVLTDESKKFSGTNAELLAEFEEDNDGDSPE